MENQNKLIGVKEIAKRANVSRATVDRVIYNRSGVSKKTKEKVTRIMEELNYQPNILARRLASTQTIRIATLLPKTSKETTYWDSLHKGILQAEKEIQPYGVEIEKYHFNQKNKNSFIENYESILKNKIDGVLLTPLYVEESIRFIGLLEENNIPYVFINSDLPNHNSLSYVGPDLLHTGYAVAHLLNYLLQGNKKVLIVNIAKELEFNHPLLRIEEGFRNYVQKNKLGFDVSNLEIIQTKPEYVDKVCSENINDQIDAIFVTSSRASIIAEYLNKSTIDKKILLLGFDFLDENIKHLKHGTIDFLICHKPTEQAFKGVTTLFKHLVFDGDIEKVQQMPIDIVTKENAAFYND